VLADPPVAKISGKILNGLNKPVADVSVILYDEKMHELTTTQSSEGGEFVLAHALCGSCTVVVSPQLNLGLASAVIEGINGKSDRNLIVQLQHGFLISGRIVSGGKGLKGMNLKAVGRSDDPAEEHKSHQGGSAKTGRSGNYSMILTPGPKRIYVNNEKRDDLAPQCQYDFDVTSQMHLPDLDLPRK
jgi:hypothetical protein